MQVTFANTTLIVLIDYQKENSHTLAPPSQQVEDVPVASVYTSTLSIHQGPAPISNYLVLKTKVDWSVGFINSEIFDKERGCSVTFNFLRLAFL